MDSTEHRANCLPLHEKKNPTPDSGMGFLKSRAIILCEANDKRENNSREEEQQGEN
jgi:hypothetical protein